jgi:hypothetical protein
VQQVTRSTGGRDDQAPEMMEKGYIYFLYRPKVEVQEAKCFDDVARMYILLKTLPKTQSQSQEEEETVEGDESSPPAFYRLIRIGKKKLPSIRGSLISSGLFLSLQGLRCN